MKEKVKKYICRVLGIPILSSASYKKPTLTKLNYPSKKWIKGTEGIFKIDNNIRAVMVHKTSLTANNEKEYHLVIKTLDGMCPLVGTYDTLDEAEKKRGEIEAILRSQGNKII